MRNNRFKDKGVNMVNQPNLWLKKGIQANKISESTNIRILKEIFAKTSKVFLQAVSLRSIKPQYEQRSRQLALF